MSFIKRGDIDHMIFERVSKKFEKTKELEQKGIKIINNWPEVHEDFWASLYKVEPQKTEPHERKSAEILGAIFDEVLESKPHQDIRNKTVTNPAMSMVGSSLLGNDFLDSLPEKLKEYEKARKEMEELKEKIRQQMKDAQEKMTPEQKEQLKKKMFQLKQLKDKLGDIEQLKQDARISFEGKAEETSNKVSGFSDLMGQEGEIEEEDVNALFDLLKNNNQIEELIKVVGRMKNIMSTAKFKNLKPTADETFDVKTGDQLKDALPSELGYFVMPGVTKLLYTQKMLDGQLICFNRKKNVVEGKGPIVCCVDESGSTNGNVIVWEKAVAVALSTIAKREKRDLFWISFACGTDIKTTFLEKGNFTIQQLADFVKHYYSGGTDFALALGACLKAVAKRPKADVVFITDGECSISEAERGRLLSGFKENETKILSICIEGRSDTLKEFSEAVYDLAMDGEEIVLQDVFNKIKTPK